MSTFVGGAVLVTGAGSGIGLATAHLLAAAGAIVVGVGRRAQPLAEAMSTLPGEGHRAVVADAAVWQDLEPAIAVGRELGGYVAAICCAGQHHMRPISLLEPEQLQQSYNANVTSALVTTKLIAKCARREGASVVWISSTAALRATAGFAAYSAAKGALLSASRVAAAELASRKIRVNVIVAGVVQTPMSESWLAKLTEEQRADVARHHLLGLGTPSDVAAAAVFLASDAARWVTGASLTVDGGLSVR